MPGVRQNGLVSERDDRPEAFIQWKGTDACIDLYCSCGRQFHFDGYFADELTCGHCGQAYELPSTLRATPVSPSRMRRAIFDESDIISDGEFSFRWPRPAFEGAKPGETFEIHDDMAVGAQRSVYVKLVRVTAESEEACVVTVLNAGLVP